MSKNLKRALLGFAVGAGNALNENYKTARAEEARRLEQERLEAIRQRERGEDRAFQRETFQMQADRELSREERMTQRQTEAEARAEERAIAREGRDEQSRRRLMQEQAEIGAKYRPPQNNGFVEYLEADGTPGTMPREEFYRLTPEQRRGFRFRGEHAQPGSVPPTAMPTQTQAPTSSAVNVGRDQLGNLSTQDWTKNGSGWRPPAKIQN
jgi:hypothetical protein